MQTNIMQTNKKKRAGKVIKWIIIIVILYVAAGALVPFMFHPKVKADAQKELDISRFYGQDSPGIDRAVVVETSQEALDARILMINEAKETIALSTFDIRPGGSCDDIFAALLDAADRGVKGTGRRPVRHDSYEKASDVLRGRQPPEFGDPVL